MSELVDDLRRSFFKPEKPIDLAEEAPASLFMRVLEECGDEIECAVVILQTKDGQLKLYRNKLYGTTVLGMLEVAKQQTIETFRDPQN